MRLDSCLGFFFVLESAWFGDVAGSVAFGAAGFEDVEGFDFFGGAVEVFAFGFDVGWGGGGGRIGLTGPAGGFFFACAHFEILLTGMKG